MKKVILALALLLVLLIAPARAEYTVSNEQDIQDWHICSIYATGYGNTLSMVCLDTMTPRGDAILGVDITPRGSAMRITLLNTDYTPVKKQVISIQIDKGDVLPFEADVTCLNNNDGTYSVYYTPASTDLLPTAARRMHKGMVASVSVAGRRLTFSLDGFTRSAKYAVALAERLGIYKP